MWCSCNPRNNKVEPPVTVEKYKAQCECIRKWLESLKQRDLVAEFREMTKAYKER